MPSNLAAYLAKNYLTASTPSSHPDGPPKKKRKKSKHHTETTSLVIADDDEDLTLSSTAAAANDDVDQDGPLMFEGRHRSAEFRKAKKSTWKTLSETQDASAGDDGGSKTTNPAHDVDDADQLLQRAQSDEARRLAEQEAENAPTIVDIGSNDGKPQYTAGGLKVGLQTAADIVKHKAEEEARATQENMRKPSKKSRRKDIGDGEGEPEEEQTVYRDATGRRIDISMRRAEVRREEAAKQVAARQEKLSAMGDVQRRELEERKRELDDAKFLTLGRGVEDEEYNDRLKEVVRWDDPMAAYMAEKEAEAEAEVDRGAVKGGRSKTSRPGIGVEVAVRRKKEYQGAAPPNRYSIKPGWRWDGVDRGNGFEKEWFQARSRKSRNETLSYEWQMDE